MRHLAFLVSIAVAAPAFASEPAAPVTLADDEVFLCLPVRTGPFEPCPKGAIGGEDELAKCLARAKANPPKMPVFRLDRGAPIDFPKDRPLCLVVKPADRPLVQVIPGDAFKLRPEPCPSRDFDLFTQETYGGFSALCRKRPHANADRLRPAVPTTK